MSASWDKCEESFHTVMEANLAVYFLIRWINKFEQSRQWRSYVKRQNTSRTQEGRHDRDKRLRRTRNCSRHFSFIFPFSLPLDWAGPWPVSGHQGLAVGSLWWLCSAQPGIGGYSEKNISRLVFILFIRLRLDYHSTSWLVWKESQTCYWSDLCVHLANIVNEISLLLHQNLWNKLA